MCAEAPRKCPNLTDRISVWSVDRSCNQDVYDVILDARVDVCVNTWTSGTLACRVMQRGGPSVGE